MWHVGKTHKKHTFPATFRKSCYRPLQGQRLGKLRCRREAQWQAESIIEAESNQMIPERSRDSPAYADPMAMKRQATDFPRATEEKIQVEDELWLKGCLESVLKTSAVAPDA